MAYIMFSTWMKYFHPVFTHDDGHAEIPSELLLPTIYKIKNWQVDGDHISVTTYTYQLYPDLIHKVIEDYSPSFSPENFDLKNIEDNLNYPSQEAHDWYYTNGHWETSGTLNVLIP